MQSTAFYYALGRPFSPVYGLAMRLRESMYSRGLLQSFKLSVPVISVGNLTMGGSGKTPVVCFLANTLKAAGYNPAVISRGYGGSANEKVNIVSDGNAIHLDARQAGDEPRMIAEMLPTIPVLTGVVRRFPAQRAIDMGADVLLLDDGFQHMAIRRESNLVLFNTDWLAGNSRVFPGGDLREPVAALGRATRFVMTGIREDNRERARRFGDLLQSKFPGKPVSFLEYAPCCLVTLNPDNQLLEKSSTILQGEPWFAFAGIAHPETFKQSLVQFGVEVAGVQGLSDHQPYTAELMEKIVKKAKQSDALGLITTEKDLVKLAPLSKDLKMPLVALRMEVRDEGDFVRDVLADLQRTPAKEPFSDI
nr:tetraacyldisaccharide 4'-kinase [uncultured Desulfobulbus sp.]